MQGLLVVDDRLRLHASDGLQHQWIRETEPPPRYNPDEAMPQAPPGAASAQQPPRANESRHSAPHDPSACARHKTGARMAEVVRGITPHDEAAFASNAGLATQSARQLMAPPVAQAGAAPPAAPTAPPAAPPAAPYGRVPPAGRDVPQAPRLRRVCWCDRTGVGGPGTLGAPYPRQHRMRRGILGVRARLGPALPSGHVEEQRDAAERLVAPWEGVRPSLHGCQLHAAPAPRGDPLPEMKFAEDIFSQNFKL